MKRELEAKTISLQTDVNIALKTKEATVEKAKGAAAAIIQNGEADADVITSYVTAELESYTKIKHGMKLAGDALVDYVWYDTLAGGSVASVNAGHTSDATQLLVGVDPA